MSQVLGFVGVSMWSGFRRLMGKGNTLITCSRASDTHLAALFFTDPLTATRRL